MADFSVGAEIKGKDRFGPVLSRMESRVSRVTARVVAKSRLMTQALARNAKRVAMLGAVAGGAAVLGVGKLTHSYITNAAELGRASKMVDVSVEKLGAYQHAMTQLGIESGLTTELFRELNNRLGDLRAGGGPIGGLLDAIKTKEAGALKRALKDAKSTEEAFLIIVGALEKMENQGQRTKFLDAMFGGPGQLMARVRSLDEFLRFAREAEESTSITTEQAEQAIRTEQSYNRLKQAAGGVANIIGARMLPRVNAVVERTTAWVRANEDWLATEIDAKLVAIGEGVRTAWEWLRDVEWRKVGDAIRDIASAISTVVEKIGGVEVAIKAVAAVWVASKLGKVVGGLRGLVGAAGAATAAGAGGGGAAAGAASTALPWLAAAGGVATVGYMAYDQIVNGEKAIDRKRAKERQDQAEREVDQAELEGGELYTDGPSGYVRNPNQHDVFLQDARGRFDGRADEALIARLTKKDAEDLDRRLAPFLDKMGEPSTVDVKLTVETDGGTRVKAAAKTKGPAVLTTKRVRRGMVTGDG